MLTTLRTIALLAGVLTAASAYAADKPGPFASSEKKLEYLLDTWTGHTLEQLREVWGREKDTSPRGDNLGYIYERVRSSRAGFSLLSGQISVSTDDVLCTATFEVDDVSTIVRVTRMGIGKDCWDLFKRYEPPSD